ncbi:MAG: hypothetical protein HYU66_28870 [Armatimonadetes bacterium]|nr:hypothetical protein [Armatimonadota bacterium]
MEQRQQSHVAATYAVTRRYLAEIRQVALTGEGADGTGYTPLPAPQQERLVALLDQITAELDRLAAALVPARVREAGERRNLSATLMWLSTLLYMVQEQVEDLQPSHMARRYGAVPAAEGELLRAAAEPALRTVRAAFRTLDERS